MLGPVLGKAISVGSSIRESYLLVCWTLCKGRLFLLDPLSGKAIYVGPYIRENY
jgi:hypothetical protein